MLYNYPKDEISKFQNELFENQPNTGSSKNMSVLNMSYKQPEVLESHANLRPLLANMTMDQWDSNTGVKMRSLQKKIPTFHHQDGLQNGIANGESNAKTSTTDKPEVNPTNTMRPIAVEPGSRSRLNSEAVNQSGDNSYYGVSGLVSFDTTNKQKAGKRRVNPNKTVPTNVGNKIVLWTDAIYEKYATTSDKLSFQNFRAWVEKHPRFLRNFSKYFRPQLWLAYNDEVTNQALLSYRKIKPALENNITCQLHPGSGRKPMIAGLYGDFLIIRRTADDVIPARIVVLKDLNMVFNQDKFLIQISHASKQYKPLEIKFNDLEAYLKWKKILENFST
jgi:hypothetical protein